MIAKCGGVCQCAYCGIEVPVAYITLDHMVPRSKGGSDNRKNIALACPDCNGKKKDNEWEPKYRDVVPDVDYRDFLRKAHKAHLKKTEKPERVLGGLVSIGAVWPVQE